MTDFASPPAGDDPGANNGSSNRANPDEQASAQFESAKDEQGPERLTTTSATAAELHDDLPDAPKYIGKIVSLDDSGFTLVCYRLKQHGEHVTVLEVTLLDVREPDDGTDDGPGPGDGDIGPDVPAPRGGLDREDEPAPEGGLLGIYEIVQTICG